MRPFNLLHLTIASIASAWLLTPALLSGCASPRTTQDASEGAPVAVNPARLAGTSWTCMSIEGAAFPDETRPSLSFSEPDAAGMIPVAGYSGVNRYGGSAKIVDAGLSFGALISTRMAGPPERMQLEAAYLGILRSVESATIAGETLTLSGGGRPLATFTRDKE